MTSGNDTLKIAPSTVTDSEITVTQTEATLVPFSQLPSLIGSHLSLMQSKSVRVSLCLSPDESRVRASFSRAHRYRTTGDTDDTPKHEASTSPPQEQPVNTDLEPLYQEDLPSSLTAPAAHHSCDLDDAPLLRRSNHADTSQLSAVPYPQRPRASANLTKAKDCPFVKPASEKILEDRTPLLNTERVSDLAENFKVQVRNPGFLARPPANNAEKLMFLFIFTKCNPSSQLHRGAPIQFLISASVPRIVPEPSPPSSCLSRRAKHPRIHQKQALDVVRERVRSPKSSSATAVRGGPRDPLEYKVGKAAHIHFC